MDNAKAYIVEDKIEIKIWVTNQKSYIVIQMNFPHGTR